MTNKLRVLVVAEHASAKFGGEAVLPLHYYRVIRARGIPVWLIVHERTREELMALFPNDGDHIIFVEDTIWHRVLWRIAHKLPARLSNLSVGFAMRLLTQVAQKRAIQKVILEQQITVVHQPMPVSPKEPSLLYGLGVPVIIGPMNGGMDYPLAFKKMQGRVERSALWLGRRLSSLMNRLMPGKRNAALLLVANVRTQQALPACVQQQRIELVVENGVDLSLWTDESQSLATNDSSVTHYVYCGRLVDWKAVDILLQAFAQAATRADISLTIIGDGVERSKLESCARELGVWSAEGQVGRVNFSGWLSQRECSVRVQAADALVLPSLMECGGAVVLEAMAKGKPVIATNWGGPADYLDDSCGMLVDPITREAFVYGLADALVAMAQSPQRRAEMGRAGRAKVLQHYDWDVKVDHMLGLYQSVQRV